MQFKKSAVTLALTSALFAPVMVSAQQVSEAVATEQEETTPVKPTEVIQITASPLARTVLDSAQPISVISGDELAERHAHTLGETLAQEPGINNSHFGGVVGSPIIRGLDGPRVKITQNGLDTADVSRASPDHAVTTETSIAQQVEILRGPATLLYGSGAIGGVVNVVDNRIAQDFIGGQEGHFDLGLNTASEQREGSLSFSSDVGSMVFHADAFARSSEDYSTPSFINDEGEVVDKVENSFIDAQGATVGLSYIFDTGYFGVSFGRMEQEYGIPGHGHHHDEHEGEEHAEEEHHEEEAGPFADLWQNRTQIHGGWMNPVNGIEKLELRYAFTDYQHQEIEGIEAASTFQNEQQELRLIATHAPLGEWNGAIGYHFFDQDLNAFGEEAYTPPSTSTRNGLFWLLERSYGDLNVQTGLRYEQVDLSAPTLNNLALNSLSFEPISASLGFTYQWLPELQVAVNYSHAERAPAGNEVYANGAHLATQTYEIGLAYELHEEGEHEYHIEAVNMRPEMEVSNNFDIGFHIELDNFHYQYNLFYNRVDDYIFEAYTGVNSMDLHLEHAEEEHAHEEEAHDHSEGLAVVAFVQRDVELFGYEMSADYAFNEAWKVNVFSDYIRARARDGSGDLPRIPAQRIGTEFEFSQQQWVAKFGYTWHGEQNQISVNETPTDSFGLLHAQVNWYPQAFSDYNLSVYAKGENLTDELGLMHTSFLKEDAPLRGRNFSIGVRGSF